MMMLYLLSLASASEIRVRYKGREGMVLEDWWIPNEGKVLSLRQYFSDTYTILGLAREHTVKWPQKVCLSDQKEVLIFEDGTCKYVE